MTAVRQVFLLGGRIHSFFHTSFRCIVLGIGVRPKNDD